MSKKVVIIIISILITLILGIVCISLSFEFKLNGSKEIELLYNTEYIEEGATLTILNQDLSNKVKITGKVNTEKVDNYEINYTFEIGFIKFHKTRTVKVKDKEKPILTLHGNEEVNICPNTEYIEEGYEAIDDYDGILTDKVIITKDKGEIKYKVSDTYGNTTIKSRIINEKDTEKPNIVLNGGTTTYIKVNSEYKEYGYKVTDNCDNLTDKVEIKSNVDTSKIGQYEVKYIVKDSSNNKTEVTRKVVVTDNSSLINNEKKGIIYLTFDDGPNKYTTARILDILKEENIKATFFVIGTGSTSLIKRIDEEGHTVALHTYTHQYHDVYRSVDAYFNDLNKISNTVEQLTGKKSRITRFPGGSTNTVSNKYSYGIMSILKQEVTNRGYIYYDWNVDSNDAGTCAKSSVTNKKACVYNNVTRNLSKSRSNVVLMHDIKSYTADALRDIIRYGKENGYTFEAITEETHQVKFR